jgi:SOS-response transcriptional repressor LexA
MANIYVSSTFLDLQEHRVQVERVIRRMGHQDVAMEYYIAEDQRPVAKCLADVAACDVYAGIFAWRYGWQPKESNPDNLSITEMEFRQAENNNKPCLIFLLTEDAPWPKKQMDKDTTKIEALRNTASAHHNADYFTTSDELARKVAEAIHKVFAPSDYRIPVWGCLTAASPMPLPDEFRDPLDWIDVTRAMLPDSKGVFALRVRGHSMIDAQVKDGDTVLVKCQRTARDGDLVVVRIRIAPEVFETTLKRFYRKGKYVALQPENPTMVSRSYKPSEVEIQAKVLFVVRNIPDARASRAR